MPQTNTAMGLQISLAVLLLQAGSAQPTLAAAPRPDAIIDAAGHAVLTFLSTWRTAWKESVDFNGYGDGAIRLRDIHCHWDGSYVTSPGRTSEPPPGVIHNGSRRSMCPNWYPVNERVPYDERVNRDAGISPMWRDRVHAARAKLLDSLATLDARKPGDAWITGQRIRFLVNQQTFNEAIAVARLCTADRAWCSQLAGFAYDAAGDYVRADSAFDAAAAAMAPKQRCEWTSAELLLESDERGAYGKLNCDERQAVDEKLWWLSTPLFSDSAPDRRSAHFSRKVLIQLHSALTWDERYDWRRRFGGEAVSEMLVRYGWPAYSVYGGTGHERDHAGWMSFYDSTRTATAEYPTDRLHLVPDWRAVGNPFHATSEAWQLNMPKLLKRDAEPAEQWWPAEHYGRAAGGILQLTEQTAMLRRDNDILLATAGALPRASFRPDSSVLIRTTAPHEVEKLVHKTSRNERAIVMTGHIPASPAVVGAELLGKPGEESARTRLGVIPPAPLSALKPGETAISEPVLLVANETAPSSPDDALSRMLGTTRVTTAKMSIYWETYGYAPGDSVEVSVVISRHEKLSKMRRIGMFLRVADDLNGSVAIKWGEPQAGHDSWAIPGVVPIQARSIRVDLSRLDSGRYSVEVLVNRRGSLAPPVRASRLFQIDRS
jgi:hypothetical protein